MARGYLDDLRQLILDQSTKVSTPVANLHGAARAVTPTGVIPTDASWLALQLPSRFDTVDAFYQGFATAGFVGVQGTRAVVQAERGAVAVTAIGDQGSILLRGSAEIERPRAIKMAVDAGSPQGSYVVVVNGQVLKQGTGRAEFRVNLDAGRHTFEVLGVTKVLGVKLPPDFPVSAITESVRPPVWKAIETSYLDQAAGTTKVELRWFTDPRAGGWRVLKRQLADLSSVLTVGMATVGGDVTLTVSGDQRDEVPQGADVYAGQEFIGTALGVSYDTATDATAITVRMPPDRVGINPQWVGQTLATGAFKEVARVARSTGASDVSWTDTAVQFGEFYEYTLQAHGITDPSTWSRLADIRLVRAGDDQAPASIAFAATYPKVRDTMARCKFTTPADADYAGVRVYFREEIEGTATGGSANTITGAFAGASTTHRVRIVGGTGAGQERGISAASLGSLTVSEPWLTVPDTSSEYYVFRDTLIKTDFGRPNQLDDFTFEPVDTAPGAAQQRYLFRTFDLTLNEQSDSECEHWLFNPADSELSSADAANITIELTGSTATTLTLRVKASTPNSGTPQVRWIGVLGDTTKVAGAELNALVASGSEWTFSRPPVETSPAYVTFEAYLAGVVTDADGYTITEQGRDTVTLRCKAAQVSSTATETVVDVAVSDPVATGTLITLTVDDQTGIGSPITPASVTAASPFVQRYTIPRPDFGSGMARVVFKAAAPGKVEDYDMVDVVPEDRDTRYTSCDPRVVSSTPTQVVVQVNADANTGTPQVELVEINGSASLVSGPAVGVDSPSGTQWTFARGAFGSGVGQVKFRSFLNGYEDDHAFVPIEEQGRDTVPLTVKCKVIDTFPDHVVVRVWCTDPFPQGTDSVTLSAETVTTGAVTPPGDITITPTPSMSTTETRDWTVFRPAFGVGPGQFIVTASAANRLDGIDSVIVPSVEQDTQYCQCVATISNRTATTVDVTVTGTPTGAQVELVSVSGTSVSAGAAAGVKVASGSTWTLTRAAFGSGPGAAVFRATKSGLQSDDDMVVVPEQGRDTVALSSKAEVIGQTDTTITVRVRVIDPYPQGPNSVTVTYAQFGTGGVTPASGQTMTPTADFATTGHLDFIVTRPTFGSQDVAQVVFTCSAANRTPDHDPVDVRPQAKLSFGPSLSVIPVPGNTVYTIGFTFVGTLTLSIDGGAYGDPGVSPISVARNPEGGAWKRYAFRCVKDGQEIVETVEVPPVGVTAPDIHVEPGVTTPTTSAFTVTATNPVGGGAAPTIKFTLHNCTADGYSGAGPHTVASGTTVIVNRPGFQSGQASIVFRAEVSGGGGSEISRTVPNQERDTRYGQCKARVTSFTSTQITVTVEGVAITGTPEVAFISVVGATLVSSSAPGGTTPGTFVPSGSTFTFDIGTTGFGQARFRARLAGYEDDDDLVVLTRDTAALDVSVTQLSADDEEIVYSVTVADPYPQGNGSITIAAPSVSNCTVTPDTAQVVNPGQATVYTVSRPAAGTGPGSITWEATAANRVKDLDTQSVQERQAETKVTQCLAVLSAATATTVTITVTGSATGATPQVRLKSAPTGSATLNSGAAVGTWVASGSTWVFNRGGFQSGTGGAEFEAGNVPGYTSDSDSVEIPEQGRDTVALQCRATVIDTSQESAVKVRVLVVDPDPQGGSPYEIHYESSGVVVNNSTNTTAADNPITGLSSGGFADYWIHRPSAVTGTGRVVFTVVGPGRVTDTDSVDVAPVAKQMPHLSLSVTPGPASYTVSAGSNNGATIEYNINGGSWNLYSTPVVEDRNAAGTSGDTIYFRATLNGLEVEKEVPVPPLEEAGGGGGGGPEVLVDSNCNGSFGSANFSPTWSHTCPTGTTFDVVWTVTSGGSGSGSQSGVTSGTALSQSWSSQVQAFVDFVVKAYFAGELIATGAANVEVSIGP